MKRKPIKLSELGVRLKPRNTVIIAGVVLVLVVAAFIVSRIFFSADTIAANYYVATDGSDSNAGTLEAPFATIQKARDVVRTAAASSGFAGANVYIRGGTYELSSTITLGSADSGKEGARISYLNYPGEKPVIRGSQTITGWEVGSDGKYTVNLNNALSGKLTNEQISSLIISDVFLNGEKQVLAQEPEYAAPTFSTDPFSTADPYNAGTNNWFFASLTNNGVYTTVSGASDPTWNCSDTAALATNAAYLRKNMTYNYKTQTDITAAMVDSINESMTEPAGNKPLLDIAPQHDWGNAIVDIASIDDTSKKITTAQDVSKTQYICPKNRYAIKNFPAALDTAKEWYQDKNTGDVYTNTLTYMPPKTLEETDRVSIPVVSKAFSLALGANYISIKGLTFEEFGFRDDPASNSGANLGAVIYINQSSNAEIAYNTIKDSAAYGVYANSTSHDLNIHHNFVYNMAHTGVFVSLKASDSTTAFSTYLIPDHIRITDNTIHDVGTRYYNDVGVQLDHSIGALVSHNEIYNTPTGAIIYEANDTIIEYNKVHDTSRLTQDAGAIYHSGRLHTRGNIVRNNLIRNTGGYGKYRWWENDNDVKFNTGTFGIYFDMATGGNTAENNIVINGTRGCIDNNGGSENSYINNYCINSGTDELSGTQILAKESAGTPTAIGTTVGNWTQMQAYFLPTTDSGGNPVPPVLDKQSYIDYYTNVNPDPYFVDMINCSADCFAGYENGDYMVKNVIKNNIFYYPDVKSAFAYRLNYINTDNDFDNNVFFDGPGKDFTVGLANNLTLTRPLWQAYLEAGYDINSRFSADSPFTDLSGDNFTLSPAVIDMGIGQISTADIGPSDQPRLEILSPNDGSEILTDSVVVEYSVDGEEFSKTFSSLQLGDNTLTLTASSPIDQTKTVTKSIIVVRKEIAPVVVIPPPEGLTNGWNMVSFPGIQNGTVLNSVLPSSFLVRKYNNATKKYFKSESTNVWASPGLAYWVKADDINKVANLSYPVVDSASVTASVSRGWNLLGNPFNADLAMSNLQIKYKNGTSRTFAQAVARREVLGYAWSFESTASPKQYYMITPTPTTYKSAAQKKTAVGARRGFWFYATSSQVTGVIMSK